jgi:AcrR family transcriptional regulator
MACTVPCKQDSCEKPEAMQATTQPILLAGQEIGAFRHVCALFDGPAELDAVVMPFLADGLKRGERAVYYIAPRSSRDRQERLGAHGVDVAALMATGQLAMPGWDEGVFQQGPFSQSVALAYISQVLAAGHAGYSRTRLIGEMGWTLDDRVQLPDLVAYESRLDHVIRRTSDVIICGYDVNRNSASTIAAVLAVHNVALVGGKLRMGHAVFERAAPRERILTAASELFHAAGTRATAVDAVIDRAGVAKATFYRHFASKDDLVVAWLRDPRTRWWDAVRAKAATAGEPHEIVAAVFEALAEWLEDSGFRGCPYVNTAAETLADEPRGIIRDYLDGIEAYLRSILAAGHYRDAGILASQLMTLLYGSIALAVARRSAAYAVAAGDAARIMLTCATREPSLGS